MLKVLSFRFQQCVIPFTMLLLKGQSKTVLFRDLSKFKNVQNLIQISKIEKKIFKSVLFPR